MLNYLFKDRFKNLETNLNYCSKKKVLSKINSKVPIWILSQINEDFSFFKNFSITSKKVKRTSNIFNASDIVLKNSVSIGKVNAHLIELSATDFAEEKCEFGYSIDDNLFYFSNVNSKCLNFTNSKGVEIVCTPKKKICKTRQEIRDFTSNMKVVKNTNQLHDNIDKTEKYIDSSSKKITNSLGMTFVKIPEGSFTMGTPIDCPNDDPFTSKNEYDDCVWDLKDYGIPAQQKNVIVDDTECNS